MPEIFFIAKLAAQSWLLTVLAVFKRRIFFVIIVVVQTVVPAQRAFGGRRSVAFEAFVVAFDAASIGVAVVGGRTGLDTVVVGDEVDAFAVIFLQTRSRTLTRLTLAITTTASILFTTRHNAILYYVTIC